MFFDLNCIIEILTTRFGETVFSSGDTAIFGCSPPFHATNFHWIINGNLENLNLSNVQAQANPVDGTAALGFMYLPTAYNGYQALFFSPAFD